MVKKFISSRLKFLQIFFLYFLDNFFFILYKKNKKNKNNNNIISIIRVDNIGDFIIYISSYNLIPKQYINFKKILICNELVYELAKSLNIFDKIITIDIHKFTVNIIYRYKILKIVSSISTKIVLQPTFSRRFETGDSLVRFIPSEKKIGFNGDNNNQNKLLRSISDKWYQELIQSDYPLKMEMDRNHEFFTKLTRKNIPFKKFNPPIFTDLNLNLKSKKEYILISPGSSSFYRNWPTVNFEKLIREIFKKYKLNIILCGTTSEEKIINKIIKNINSNNLIFKTDQTLLEFIEIIRNSILVIGNDSSPVHIANFVNVKSICLFGGSSPGRFFPYPKRIKNRPLIASNKKCKSLNWRCSNYHNCLLQTNVDDVLELIEKKGLISKNLIKK
jgi:ADP-heptose:LPS heptosyltransferase